MTTLIATGNPLKPRSTAQPRSRRRLFKTITWNVTGFAISVAIVSRHCDDTWEAVEPIAPAALTLTVAFYYFDGWWDRVRKDGRLGAGMAIARSASWRIICAATVASFMLVLGFSAPAASGSACIHAIVLTIAEFVHNRAYEKWAGR
jgi:hypothetical protein